MFICLSPGGQMTSGGAAATDALLVGTVDGIFSFARSGSGWAQRERFLSGQHVSALLFEPSSKTLFAGTFGAALFASGDLGRNWERRDTDRKSTRLNSSHIQKSRMPSSA